MDTMLRHAREQHATLLPKLNAQTHALAFYSRLGWQRFGGEFDEAGIPHVAMVWVPPDAAARERLAARSEADLTADVRALLDA